MIEEVSVIKINLEFVTELIASRADESIDVLAKYGIAMGRQNNSNCFAYITLIV